MSDVLHASSQGLLRITPQSPRDTPNCNCNTVDIPSAKKQNTVSTLDNLGISPQPSPTTLGPLDSTGVHFPNALCAIDTGGDVYFHTELSLGHKKLAYINKRKLTSITGGVIAGHHQKLLIDSKRPSFELGATRLLHLRCSGGVKKGCVFKMSIQH